MNRRTFPRGLAIGIDLAVVIVFVAIGRSSHHHGLRLNGLLSTLWPFALGLAFGWLIAATRRHGGASLRGGFEIGLVTVAVGMLARAVADQGTAFAFILVAGVFLVGLMVAWRFLCQRSNLFR